MREFYNFVSLLSCFYQNQCSYIKLSFIFQINMSKFNKSLGSLNQLPSYLDIQRFFLASVLKKLCRGNYHFRNFFKKFKECWICLISMYEILHEKSFDTFVNNFIVIIEKTIFFQL